jgi:glycosyltransferase involved in cell wall biosynthesis
MNNLTMHSHPLKILEYLSAGRPVVSVNIPEAMKYKEVIEIAVDYKGFVEKIEKCLKENSKEMADERIKFAKEESWERRFNEIQGIVSDNN